MFNNASFFCLWSGQAFSNFGDRLYFLAVITFIYSSTDSALLASFVPLIRLIMQLFSSLLTPVLTAKVSLKSILVTSQLLQSFLFLILILFLMFYGKHIFFIGIVVALLSFLHSWIYPLKYAILPSLITSDDLVKANNVMSITNQVVMFLGWIGGGFLVSKLGSILVLWVTLGCFLLSALLFSFIKVSSKPISSQDGFVWKIVLEGWVFVVKTPLYRRLFVIAALLSLAGSVWSSAIILVFVKEILIKDELWWGFLNGAWLLGTIIGGFALSKWIQNNLSFSLVMGLFGNAVVVVLFISCSDPILILGMAFLLGIPYQVHDVAKRTLLQINAETKKLAQIFAAYQAVGTIFFGIGIFVMGFLVDFTGIKVIYYLSAVLVMVSGVLAINIWNIPSKMEDSF